MVAGDVYHEYETGGFEYDVAGTERGNALKVGEGGGLSGGMRSRWERGGKRGASTGFSSCFCVDPPPFQPHPPHTPLADDQAYCKL